MTIKVGKYELNGTFASAEEAKGLFLEHYPDVTEKDLDSAISKKKFNADKSGDAEKADTEGDKGNAEAGKKVARGK